MLVQALILALGLAGDLSVIVEPTLARETSQSWANVAKQHWTYTPALAGNAIKNTCSFVYTLYSCTGLIEWQWL